MTVHQICDNCGMEFDHTPVTSAGRIFCCAGCSAGGPCTCRDTVVVTGNAVVIESAPAGASTGEDWGAGS